MQDVIDGGPPFRRPTNPETQPGEFLPANGVDDVCDTPVPPRSTPGSQSDPPEGEIQIVEDHDQVAGALGVGQRTQGGHHRAAGGVHEGLGLQQADPGRADAATAETSEEHSLGNLDLVATGEGLEQVEANIVPRPRVASPGIAEPHDEPHAMVTTEDSEDPEARGRTKSQLLRCPRRSSTEQRTKSSVAVLVLLFVLVVLALALAVGSVFSNGRRLCFGDLLFSPRSGDVCDRQGHVHVDLNI